MTQEPKIRLVIAKQQLLADLKHIKVLVDEYCQLLAAGPSPEALPEKAQELLARHGLQLQESNLSLQTLDLVAAVLRQVFSLQPGERVSWIMGDGHASAEAEPAASAASHPLLATPQTHRELIAQINALACNAPLAMQEKLRFLLGCLMRLLDALPQGTAPQLDELLTEVNMLTSNRESQNLVREIAILARHVANTINTLSEELPADLLEESASGISEAASKMRGVIQRLEQVANTNLDALEHLSSGQADLERSIGTLEAGLKTTHEKLQRLLESHPEQAEALQAMWERLTTQVAAATVNLRESNTRHSQLYLSLMSNQGFQDLTGQTLKKIIAFVESLQTKLVQVLEQYRDVLTLSQTPKPTKEPAAPGSQKTQQSQDQVDNLLANLGF